MRSLTMRFAGTPRASARVSLSSFRRVLRQKMRTAAWRATATCLGAVALVLGTAGVAAAQTAAPRPPVRPVVEAQGFGLVPLGSWSHHVYETVMPGLSLHQFGPGGGGALTIGLRNIPGPKWDLMLRGSYGVLGTGEWESYAAQHGSDVSASARLGNVALLLTRDIDVSPAFRIAVGGGPGVAWGSGEESDPATTTYSYTMMKTAASLTVGARGILALSPVFSLVGELSGMLGTPIVSYGQGDDRWLTALVGGVGVRATL
jgi:hypothetical protein